MAEILFEINETTGELQMEVKGVMGPACDKIVEQAKALLGDQAIETKTSEYHLRPKIQPTARGQR